MKLPLILLRAKSSGLFLPRHIFIEKTQNALLFPQISSESKEMRCEDLGMVRNCCIFSPKGTPWPGILGSLWISIDTLTVRVAVSTSSLELVTNFNGATLGSAVLKKHYVGLYRSTGMYVTAPHPTSEAP